MPENNENIITNGLEDKDSKYYKDEYERLNKENIQHRRAGVFRFILAAVFIGGGIALAIMNPIGAIGAVLAGGSLGLGLVSFDLANKCMKQVKSPEKINDAVVNLLHDKILKRIKEKDLTECTKALKNISEYFTKRLKEEEQKLSKNWYEEIWLYFTEKDIDVQIKQLKATLKNINDALKEIQPSAVSSKTGDQKQDIKEQTNNSQSNTVKIERAAAAVLDNSNVITEARKTFSGKMDRQTLVESNSRARANSVKVKSGENSGLGV